MSAAVPPVALAGHAPETGGRARRLHGMWRRDTLADFMNPSVIDTSLDSRAVSFENPSGARGSGGTAANGRKGAPSQVVGAGERVLLADIGGPGVLRHLWMTVLPAPPERLRKLRIEVFYDGADEPSVSVPMLDFFCLPHGRTAPFSSALVAVNEGRGFNSTIPMPFADHLRMEFENCSDVPTVLYYQADYTLEPAMPTGCGYLHASFRRENPTTLRSDFVITEGLAGPGAFPRVQPGGPGPRRGHVVRGRRGEGVSRRRHHQPHHLRDWAGGLRRQRLGHGRPRHPVWRVHPRRSRPRCHRAAVTTRLRRPVPLARPRPDHVCHRPQSDRTADRGGSLPSRPGGRDGRHRGRREARRPGVATHAVRSPSASSSASTTCVPRPTSTVRSPRRWSDRT